MPVILRHWLKREHVRPEVQSLIRDTAPRFLSDIDGFDEAELVVRAQWAIARSNMLVCGRHPPKITKSEFSTIVEDGRKPPEKMLQLRDLVAEDKIRSKYVL
ncbi:unnamed protein product [Clonostachys rhizophaga]|uniref:Uncharacterized protein n=1 Tax=Clonostachys rhizophaga TaxID=160324 RepID=A0A9N9VYV0_9HYPO|nr:unnamed protein product [Clonostachys rhizophaga]